MADDAGNGAEFNAAIAASIIQLALVIEEIAAGGRGKNYRKISGFAIQLVIPAIGRSAPRNLAIADAGRIGIHRAVIVVDLDLPARAAGEIGAGDRGLAASRFTADGGDGKPKQQRADCRYEWQSPSNWPQSFPAHFILNALIF
jgi:hypothetical protein